MSIDFGNYIFVNVKNETLKPLKYIENICYMKDSWYDNKCGPSDGYLRETVLFETKDYIYNYVVDNSIFSGFVSPERVVILNKKTNIKKTYKLKKKSESKEDLFPDIISSSIKLSKTDYIFTNSSYSDNFGDEEGEKYIPQLYILNKNEDYIIVNAQITKKDSCIIIKLTSNGLFSITYYNKATGEINENVLVEVNDNEYIDAAIKANNELFCNQTDFCFPSTIQLSNDKVSVEKEDIITDDNIDKRIENMCSDAILPSIPKLNIAEYKDNVLTMPKTCNYLSDYLVKFILHSLNITSDEDLNNYYYRDDVLDKLHLDLIIPGNIKVIGPSAFCNKHFKSITIENGVEVINRNAFSSSYASTISLPTTITTIEDYAFRENMMKEIYISENVTHISGNAFLECSELDKIILDGNNKIYRISSSNKALIEINNDRLVIVLNNVIIPEGVKIIGHGCFSRLSDKGELTIPKGVEKIEDNAFEICNYSNIIFPDTLVEIGKYTFYNCRGLTKLIFPSSLRKIGTLSFRAGNLGDVYFNSNVEVGSCCFGEKTNIHGLNNNKSLESDVNKSDDDMPF